MPHLSKDILLLKTFKQDIKQESPITDRKVPCPLLHQDSSCRVMYKTLNNTSNNKVILTFWIYKLHAKNKPENGPPDLSTCQGGGAY